MLKVDDATDLDLIARCAGVSAATVRGLNPALLRGASPAGLKDYPVRVPKGTGAKARRALGKIPADRRLTWRRHKVEPRQIVGALANEGGLRREDFGAIQIRPDFSLVELPADLPASTLDRLSETRISGKLIEIRLDTGGPSARRT